MLNCLSIDDVASLLQVTSRTIAHWESGDTRIPYSAFKLLRFLANGELLPKAWEGWRIRGDTLWSPAGKPFKQHEFTYLANYFTMARMWQAERALRSQARQERNQKPVLTLIKGGKL